MILDENSTYYDTLEVSPDASPNEIRESYLRLKAAYSRGSVALYTLMDRDETERMLERIEEAYHVLSNKEKRREYDRNHGLLTMESELESAVRPSTPGKIISIDRRSAESDIFQDEGMLVAPSTDFTSVHAPSPQAPDNGGSFLDSPVDPPREPRPEPRPAPAVEPVPERPAEARQEEAARRKKEKIMQLENEIQDEQEWKGDFIRYVRETRNVSLEEMAEFTKVTKTYLRAIESEDFSKLPAAVYLRGFIVQIAKKLKLPHDKVAAAYIHRYRQACPDKA